MDRRRWTPPLPTPPSPGRDAILEGVLGALERIALALELLVSPRSPMAPWDGPDTSEVIYTNDALEHHRERERESWKGHRLEDGERPPGPLDANGNEWLDSSRSDPPTGTQA